MRCKSFLKRILLLLLVLSLTLPIYANVMPVQAASVSVKKAEDGKWVTRNKKVFYMVSGKRQKGLNKIKGEIYYFDSEGVQRTGWQKIGKKYYYFNIANGKKGYMIKDQKINGIKLQKNGTAKVTADNKVKIKALIKATEVVEKITKPTMTKSEKLEKCFQYCTKKLKYRGARKFEGGKNWDAKYVLDMLGKGRGNCYAYGATFAYLANASGYEDAYAVSSGGHGWAEVKNKIYDPSWELVDKKHDYYGLSYKLSGVDGRPNYKNGKKHVKKV